jgi:hypothetical protein
VFTWLNKQGVRSTLGFEVQRVDRFTVRYREGLRTISVYVESGFCGGPCLLIADAAFEKWDNSSVANSAKEQRRIRKNFCDAMAFQGMGVM